jgi:flagellar basal-body rod modification protein FlgD
MVNSSNQVTPDMSAYSTSTNTNSTSSTSGSASDTNQFMIMLMAQLKNQDPLNPVDNSQMLGQMAQLNSLSQLQDLNSKMEELLSASQIGYASSLVGKDVTASVPNKDPIEGVVTAVSNESGSWQVTIGGQTVPLTNVIGVKEATTA